VFQGRPVKETLGDQRTPAPVGLTAGAAAAFRPLPLSASRIADGFWARRQQANRTAALPAGLRRLRESGAFRNLRRAAGQHDGHEGHAAHEGPLFIDSDMYKWLEAIAWEQARAPSPALAAEQAETTALIAAAQQPDGYLNTYVQLVAGDGARFTDLTSGHELYCAGHLIQAAVAQHRSTRHRDLLDVAVRFADLLTRTFGPGKRRELDGHPLIEMALVELYRETGTTRYLELARHFVETRGQGRATGARAPRPRSYYSDRVPVRAAATVEGHAVRALYLAAGATDCAAETGDDELLAALRRQWEAMVATKMYVTGGVGARWDGEAFGQPYELPPDGAYCETCAAIGSIQWAWRMLLRTGEPRYADLIERTLYNAFLPGVALDGTAYFYANALQVRSGAADDEPRNPANGRAGWFGVACCPPNIMRTMSSLGSLLATRDDDGIQIHQYAASTITADLPAGTAGLVVTTNYPWEGHVEITVEAAPDQDWGLSLRIPGWCTGAEARVGGTRVAGICEPGTYLHLRRRWAVGDCVVLDLPMPVRQTAAHERVDAVRGCVAVERGPLVYCLEQADLPDDVPVDDVRLDGGEGTAVWTPDLLEGVTVIQLAGRVTANRGPLYPAQTADAGPTADAGQPASSVRLTAIPYFAWANRGPGAMRVWIPLDRPG
jgi:hypothetical protein